MSDAPSEATGETTPTESESRPIRSWWGRGRRPPWCRPRRLPRHRPFMVTILAIVVRLLAVLAAVHLLQALGIVPYVIGRLEIRTFSLLYAIMWGADGLGLGLAHPDALEGRARRPGYSWCSSRC